jgi:hypothetical protein
VPQAFEVRVRHFISPFEFYFYNGTSIKAAALKFSSEHVSAILANFPRATRMRFFNSKQAYTNPFTLLFLS